MKKNKGKQAEKEIVKLDSFIKMYRKVILDRFDSKQKEEYKHGILPKFEEEMKFALERAASSARTKREIKEEKLDLKDAFVKEACARLGAPVTPAEFYEWIKS